MSVKEAFCCKFQGIFFYYTLRTRGVECALIRRTIGVRDAYVGVREAIMLDRGLLVAALLLLLFPLFNIVQSYDGEILITVGTYDNRVLSVKLLYWQ